MYQFEIIMKIEDIPIHKDIIDVLRRHGIDELYPPQSKALPHVLKGKNMVLSIPTASGKSLIAYIGIINKLLREGGKALYIVPLKALAKEKFEEFWKYKWTGSKKEAFARFLKVMKTHSFEYLMKQVKDYHKYLHLEKTVRKFDRQKLMASVFLNPAKERFAEPWGEYCNKITGTNEVPTKTENTEVKNLFEKNNER